LAMKRVLFLFIMISFLAAQSVTETEITSEPSHHLVSDEWGGVRVFRVEVGPHAATVLHRHRRDYVSVTLGDAHILNEVEGKPPVDLKLNDGDTRFTPGNFAHIVKNLTDQPFRNVTIEFPSEWKTRHAPSSRGKDSGEETFPGGHIKTLFVKDGVRVSEINLDPGATVPNHRYDGRHLVVAISDLDLRSDIDGMDPMSLKFESGDARWLPGGYTNTGVRAARFVTLGF
jgi:hypothetical protein